MKLAFISGVTVFQFTLPCRERPHASEVASQTARFNSRSRVGSDPIQWANVRRRRVSIHAPV